MPIEKYWTRERLSFDNLLGCDKEMARLLAACPALDAHLALVTKTETGPAKNVRTGMRWEYKMLEVRLCSVAVAVTVQPAIDKLICMLIRGSD